MNKYLIFFSVLVVVAALGYGLQDVLFLNQKWANEKKQTQRLTVQVNLLFCQQMRLEEEATQFLQLQQTVREWQGKLIKSADISKLLREIKKMARLNHLEIKAFHASDTEKVDQYKIVSIQIVTLGNYNQAIHFIDQVAQLPWLVAIGDLAFANDMQQTNLLAGDINLNVYSVR